MKIIKKESKQEKKEFIEAEKKLKIELILSHLIALESSKSISELISEVSSDNSVSDKITEPAS